MPVDPEPSAGMVGTFGVRASGMYRIDSLTRRAPALQELASPCELTDEVGEVA